MNRNQSGERRQLPESIFDWTEADLERWLRDVWKKQKRNRMDLLQQIRRDEGEVLHVYLDSKGIRTGGVGHNLQAHGIDWPVGTPISKELSDQWLAEDCQRACDQVNLHLPWVLTLDEARRGVLYNMCFNMGIKGLLGFKNTLAAVETGDYSLAAIGMLHSAWASQVHDRAKRLANQMETGVWE